MAETAQRISAFRSLDAVRGLAALWVVMDHSCDRYVTTNQLQHWPIYAFSLRGQLGVVIFFLISGYCITAAAYRAFGSGKKVRGYAWDRVRRIYPPYFFAILVGLAVSACLSFAQAHHWIPPVHHKVPVETGVLYWIANFLLLQSELHQPFFNIVFWSLCFEASFYVIVGIFLFVTQQIEKRRGPESGLFFFSLAVGALTVESLLWQICSGSSGIFPLDLWYQFGIGGLFFLAAEITSPSHKGFSVRLHRVHHVLLGLAAALMVLFGATRVIGGEDVTHPSSRMQVMVLLLVLAGFWFLRSTEARYIHRPVFRPLFWLGSFSYSLYLVHPIFLPFVDFVGRRLGFKGSLYLIDWALEISISVVAGWVFFLLFERHFISSRQKQRALSELHPEAQAAKELADVGRALAD